MLDRETIDRLNANVRNIMAERDEVQVKLSLLQDELTKAREELDEVRRKLREQAIAHKILHLDKARMASKIADLSRRLNDCAEA